MNRAALVKAGVLVALVAVAVVVAQVHGLPSGAQVRREVRSQGAVGPLVFVAGYAVLVLFPSPKGVFTAAAGAVFGWWSGAALALTGALIGSVVAFEIARLLGRDLVRTLTGPRLARAETALRDHGLTTILALRLAPVIPFTLVNYGSGVGSLRRRDFILGSALGMIPGALAYSAVGAFGSSRTQLWLALAALAVLTLVGGWWGRRLLRGQAPGSAVDPAVDPAVETPERPA